MSREIWLKGLKREIDQVMVYPTICCAGCGAALGEFSYVPGVESSVPKPDWPFNETDCPVCYLRSRAHPPEPRDKLLDRMNAIRRPDKRDESLAEDLYARLESLSKALEGSGRIDEHDHPNAYATVLDAMNFVLAHK